MGFDGSAFLSSQRSNRHVVAGRDSMRNTLLTPDAIRQMVILLNEDIRLRAEHRRPDLD